MPRMEKLNLQSPIFKVVNIPNILFAAILYMISLPPLVKTKPPAMLIIVICLIELYFIIGYLVQHKRSCHDISCILFAFFAIWEYSSKTGKAHSLLMPPMENVLYVLYSHRGELLKGLVSSLELMLWGVTIALASSVVFGVLVGWFTRPREAIMPIGPCLYHLCGRLYAKLQELLHSGDISQRILASVFSGHTHGGHHG